MRVEIATPETLVEVYDVDAPTGASDAYVLAACRPLAPVSAERRSAGGPFVLSRRLEELEAIADAMTAGRQAEAAAREYVLTPESEAVGERVLAEKFGVDRQTIRRWRGKDKGRGAA